LGFFPKINNTNYNDISFDLFRFLRRTGLNSVFVGVESGNPLTINNVNDTYSYENKNVAVIVNVIKKLWLDQISLRTTTILTHRVS
jgi:radical SAM superfamily enzyme YgiQ (UPF0313 family)